MATERLAILLETVGSSAVVRDLEKVSGATRGLGDKATAAAGSLRGVKGAGQQLQGAIGGLTGVLTASAAGWAAIIGFGAHAVGTFGELALNVENFQRASGASAEQASMLIAALDDVGVSAETGSKAIFQLGKRLDTQGAALAEYGVFAARGADGNVDLSQTLLDVADAYNQTADPAARAGLLTAAFGKTGQQLIPILERGRAGIEALFEGADATGQILSQEDIDNARTYRESMDELGDSFREISIQAGQALVPAVAEVATGIAALVQKANDLGRNRVWQFLVRPVTMTWDALVGGAENSAEAIRKAGEATEDMAKKIAAAEKEAEQFRDSAFGLVDAQRDLDSASRALGGAQRDLADKQRDLSELLSRGAVDEKAVASARRDLTSATKDAGRAADELADAQERLVEAQEALSDLTSGKTGAEAVAEAQDDLTRSQLRQRSAVQRQIQAQNSYNKVAIDGTSTAFELADAQLELDQANFDLTEANQDVTTAQTALNEAERIGAENSPEVIQARKDVTAAQQGVADATNNVADANQNVKDKTDALGTALAGDPNYKKEVADARQAVADATQHVADASHNVADKAYQAYLKQKDFNTAMEDGVNKARDLKRELEILQTEHPELASLFAPVLGSLQTAIVNAVAKNPRVTTPMNRVGPAVPALAGGGIVTEPLLAHIGEAGPEAVIPLSRGASGLGGPTFYVTVQAGIAGDVDRVAAELHGALSRIAKRGFGNPWDN